MLTCGVIRPYNFPFRWFPVNDRFSTAAAEGASALWGVFACPFICQKGVLAVWVVEAAHPKNAPLANLEAGQYKTSCVETVEEAK